MEMERDVLAREGPAAEMENAVAGKAGILARRPLYCFVKRAFDITASFLGLLLLSPVFLVTAIGIFLEDGGPVFYTQTRIGKDCRAFRIYKFRSMQKNTDAQHEQLRKEHKDKEVSFKLKEDPRITKVGKVIRRFNIDELPQLVNILKGDMSFVGPRPLPDYEYKEEQRRYGSRYARRYSVPQGLTCYWQLSDRAERTFEERMQMDVDYAGNATLAGDLKMIIKTAVYTVTGKAGY